MYSITKTSADNVTPLVFDLTSKSQKFASRYTVQVEFSTGIVAGSVAINGRLQGAIDLQSMNKTITKGSELIEVLNADGLDKLVFVPTGVVTYTLATALTGVAEIAVVVDQSIDANVPASGNLTIVLDSASTLTVAYTSWSGSTFTITSTNFSAANVASIGNAVYEGLVATAPTFTATIVSDH